MIYHTIDCWFDDLATNLAALAKECKFDIKSTFYNSVETGQRGTWRIRAYILVKVVS